MPNTIDLTPFIGSTIQALRGVVPDSFTLERWAEWDRQQREWDDLVFMTLTRWRHEDEMAMTPGAIFP